MNQWNNKVAVVTGASSGIGAAIVIDLLKSGMIVVGLARRKEKVEELAKDAPSTSTGKLHALKCDVSIEADVKNAFEWIDKNLGGCDVLINNAGVLHFFHLTDSNNTEMLQQTINTNLLGAAYCAREAYQSMKRRNFDGHIILMNSVGGHNVPFFLSSNRTAYLNAYHSTKYGLTAMVEVLRQEFQHFGAKIKISSVSPGVVKTEIFGPGVINQMDQIPHLNPEDVSAAVLYILGTPSHVQVHDLILKPINEPF